MDPFFCYLCFVIFCYTVLSVPCSFAVTCWEKTNLYALLGAAGSSLTCITVLCPWARYIYPNLALNENEPFPKKNCLSECLYDDTLQ